MRRLFPHLLLLTLAISFVAAQEERSRIRRPRLRVRPDEGRVEQEADEEEVEQGSLVGEGEVK